MLTKDRTYNLDLRSSELLLIQRAIKMYVQNYTAMKSTRTDVEGKQEAQSYINAAYNLSNRLTHAIKENT